MLIKHPGRLLAPEGNEGGGGGQGGEGGNEGGEGGGGEATFTQAQVEDMIQNRVAKLKSDNQALQAELKNRPNNDDVAALKTQIEELEEKAALGEGATEAQREAHQLKKQNELKEAKINDLQKNLDSLRTQVEDRDRTLERERMARTFGDALDRHNVLSTARGDALETLLREVGDKIEKGADGSIRATWGDLVGATPDEVVQGFLKTKDYYVAAKGRGAGSTPGGPPKDGRKLHERSNAELTRMADENR